MLHMLKALLSRRSPLWSRPRHKTLEQETLKQETDKLYRKLTGHEHGGRCSTGYITSARE